MISQTAIDGQRTGLAPHRSVDVHYGRFLDAGLLQFRTRIKHDMPNFNFERLMASGDRWILTARDGADVSGMAVFSGTRESPVMDFYYAVDALSASLLMAAINHWRKK